MTTNKDHIEMAFKSADAFADDGKLDARELSEIVDIAERDGLIDRDEIRVLRNIISRLDPSEVDRALKAKLAELLDKLKPEA